MYLDIFRWWCTFSSAILYFKWNHLSGTIGNNDLISCKTFEQQKKNHFRTWKKAMGMEDYGASINYVDKQGEGRGSPKCQHYYISLFSKYVNKGGRGAKNPHNSVNVVYGYPLIIFIHFAVCLDTRFLSAIGHARHPDSSIRSSLGWFLGECKHNGSIFITNFEAK